MKPLPSDPFAGFPSEDPLDNPSKGLPPKAERCGSARPEQRLSDIATGRDVRIRSTRDETARRRLSLYGLIEGAEVKVEKRGGSGDLIVRFGTARYFIPANLAHAIGVTACR